MVETLRTCIRCGDPFDGRPEKRFCSAYCQARKYQVLPMIAGKCWATDCESVLMRRVGRDKPKYCSHACNIRHLNAQRYIGPKPLRRCARCQTTFTPGSGQPRKFCSKYCRRASQVDEVRDRLFPEIHKVCKCGVAFKTRSSKKVWCNMKCSTRNEEFRGNDLDLFSKARAAIMCGVVNGPTVTKREDELEYAKQMRSIGKAVKQELKL